MGIYIDKCVISLRNNDDEDVKLLMEGISSRIKEPSNPYSLLLLSSNSNCI